MGCLTDSPLNYFNSDWVVVMARKKPSGTQLSILGVKEFVKDIDKINKSYRYATMISLTQSLDNIRHRAAREGIIPKSPDLANEKRPWVLSKKQPSDPVRVTFRTGALFKMLTDRGKWKGLKTLATGYKSTTKQVTMQTRALKGVVKVTQGFRTGAEHYEATLRVKIENTSGLVYRRTRTSRDVEGNHYSYSYDSESKKTLAMRFRHETGIRGHKRPFIRPAAEKEVFTTKRLMDEKLNIISRL